MSFTIETFDDPETSQPTQYGRFSRHWQDEEALDVLIDKLEAAGQMLGQALLGSQACHADVHAGLGCVVVGVDAPKPRFLQHTEDNLVCLPRPVQLPNAELNPRPSMPMQRLPCRVLRRS